MTGALPWALGRYSFGLVAEWSLPDGFDADEVCCSDA